MNIKPVLLAGGMGSRLRPYTFCVPKPLLPIGEKPIIELSLYWLKSHGIDEVAIALGWRGEIIRAYVGDGSRFGMKVVYAQEDDRMGTAGPLTHLLEWIGKDDVFLTNGDILTQMDLAQFVDFHSQHGAALTIATRMHKTQSPFGVLSVIGGTVTGVQEKPMYTETISAGMYIVRNSTLGFIPHGAKPYDMTDLVMTLLRKGKMVKSYPFTDPWIAVETLGDYDAAANEAWLSWSSSIQHRNLQIYGSQARATDS